MVGHRLAVRQVDHRPRGAAEQVAQQLAVDLRLQPFFGAFIHGQRRRCRVFRRRELIPRQEANDVRLFDPAVVINRPSRVAQPGQHTALQFAGAGKRLEQGLACRVLKQGLGVQRSVQHVWANGCVPGFDHEEVADGIRRCPGFAAQGQWAQDDFLAVDNAVCGGLAHQRFHIAIAGGGDPVLLPNRVFQGAHRQLHFEFAGEEFFPAARIGGVRQQQVFDLLRVGCSDVDTLDQALAAQQVIFAQPARQRAGGFGP